MKNRLPGHKKPRADRRRLRHERRSESYTTFDDHFVEGAEQPRNERHPDTSEEPSMDDFRILIEMGPDWASQAQRLTPD